MSLAGERELPQRSGKVALVCQLPQERRGRAVVQAGVAEVGGDRERLPDGGHGLVVGAAPAQLVGAKVHRVDEALAGGQRTEELDGAVRQCEARIAVVRGDRLHLCGTAEDLRLRQRVDLTDVLDCSSGEGERVLQAVAQLQRVDRTDHRLDPVERRRLVG